jgi:hypothetical protein
MLGGLIRFWLGCLALEIALLVLALTTTQASIITGFI